MKYKIVDIRETANGFEVDVEYVIDNEKKMLRFAFAHDAWNDEKWRKVIEHNLLNIKKSKEMAMQKEKYVNKEFTVSEDVDATEERPSAAVTKL